MGVAIAVVCLATAILCIAGRIPSGTFVQKAMLAVDILVSTLVWGAFDITISARCGLYLRQAAGPWLWRTLGRGLNAISKGHCETAIANDGLRARAAIKALQIRLL
jgi:hypothetical protein